MPETTTEMMDGKGNISYVVLHCPKCFGLWTIPDKEDYHMPLVRASIECPHCKETVNATVEGW